MGLWELWEKLSYTSVYFPNLKDPMIVEQSDDDKQGTLGGNCIWNTNGLKIIPKFFRVINIHRYEDILKE